MRADTEITQIFKAAILKIADEQEVAKQSNIQFPNNWEQEEVLRWKEVSEQLKILPQIIKDAKGDIALSDHSPDKLVIREKSGVAQALIKFRSLLDDILSKKVMTGRHFNPKVLFDALNLHSTHFESFFGSPQNNLSAMLSWQQVIGYLQRLFPANYSQNFCDPYNSSRKINSTTAQNRLFKLAVIDVRQRSGREINFYPISDLGFNFAIGVIYNVIGACPRAECMAGGRTMSFLMELECVKSNNREKLMRCQQETSNCLVM